ncbi:MAG: MTA/SAH nucleosidase [bacterium]|nr:MAG: MTA/SAH nucleosidase [bacterium]
MIQTVIFDMDGTLYSSEEMILPAYQRGIRAFNKRNPHQEVPIPTLDSILALLGFPINEIYSTLFPSLSSDGMLEIRELILTELLKAIRNKEGQLFPGVIDSLHELSRRGYGMYIASNGQSLYLEAILESYDLISLFQPIITLDYKSLCDKGDILLAYQKRDQLDKAKVVMVGDRDSDMDAAQKMGCAFIACQYGHGDKSETESAEIIVSSFPEVIGWIERI